MSSEKLREIDESGILVTVSHWGQRFKQLREERQLSQDAVAANAGTTRKTVIAFELRGDVGWSILQAMIYALGVKEADFFESKTPKVWPCSEHELLHNDVQEVLDWDGTWKVVLEGGVELAVKGMRGEKQSKKRA